MPTQPSEAARNYEHETCIPGRRGDPETSGTVAEAIREACEAIQSVKTNVERFVSRAT